MSSLFTKIIKGEIPSHKIAEDDQFFSFLDIRPVAAGHALVVPKKEVDYIYDLDDETLAELTVFSKKIASALRSVVPCNRIGISVIGLEVPHAHVHLIPISTLSDMDFSKPRVDMSPDEMETLAQKIAAKVVL